MKCGRVHPNLRQWVNEMWACPAQFMTFIGWNVTMFIPIYDIHWMKCDHVHPNSWHSLDEIWACSSQFMTFIGWNLSMSIPMYDIHYMKCDHVHPNLWHSLDEMWPCPSIFIKKNGWREWKVWILLWPLLFPFVVCYRLDLRSDGNPVNCRKGKAELAAAALAFASSVHLCLVLFCALSLSLKTRRSSVGGLPFCFFPVIFPSEELCSLSTPPEKGFVRSVC